MSLYPPLTEAQITELNTACHNINVLKCDVSSCGLVLCTRPGDEDELLRHVSALRGEVQKLDLALFRIYGLVHRLKESNVPTTVQPTRRPPPSLDDLEGMLS
jgi:hypothetical protein